MACDNGQWGFDQIGHKRTWQEQTYLPPHFGSKFLDLDRKNFRTGHMTGKALVLNFLYLNFLDLFCS